MTVARVDGLGKAFAGRTVLTGVGFELGEGEVLSLIGHNGSGKTTLLRTLATTVLPDTGTITVSGVDLLADPLAARRHVGVTLADERAWYWRLTGRHNLEFFAGLHGLRRRAARRRAHELLQIVGLADAADRPFGQYSSGMRLRLSLARAILGEPRLLLLDEPTRSIDPEGADGFRELIAEHVARTGAAAVLASHDLEEVAQLADRVLLMRVGREPIALDGALTAAGLRGELAEEALR